MSEMMMCQANDNTENVDQKALELAQDFSYDGYQVVRRELFAHLREPAVVIRRDSVTFNTACIAGLEDAVYIQILVNQDNKRMVVRKCEENDKDALRWCIEKPDKRKSRKMSNKLFSAMVYDMMGWDTDCRYKILGHKITHEDETMSKKRPFYAMDDPEDTRYTLSFDLLYHGLEITTGGQRIHDLSMLEEKIQEKGMTEEGLEQYLDAFRFGMPPHGGLGIGLERLTMQLLGEDNVREACLFPRDMSRLEP